MTDTPDRTKSVISPGRLAPLKHPNGLYGYEFQGRVVRLAKVTVVPYRRHSEAWTCVVVESINPSYPVGGYDIVVGDDELGTGTIIEILREAETTPDPLAPQAEH